MLSELEFSPGASPRYDAYWFPFANLSKSPFSTINDNAVCVLIPRKHFSFLTLS